VPTLTPDEIQSHVRQALDEDIGTGDVTSLAVIPETLMARAQMVARESLVVAGLPLAREAFAQVCAQVTIEACLKDGDQAARGAVLMRVEGPARAILGAERVALNFAQRLSGVATLAAEYVRRVAGTRAAILDTRKTTPGWRRLEKYAVVCGGARNHRMGLHDMVLIKDNHLAALKEAKPNAIATAVTLARRAWPGLKVEVEADELAQVQQALEAGADMVLLDNMSLDQLRAAVQMANGRAALEASGGVSLETVAEVARTGVDVISVGAMTHSARAVDIGLDFQ
jgi:nicotinate-nucleotide pyrophosphorylase (carboxylating)